MECLKKLLVIIFAVWFAVVPLQVPAQAAGTATVSVEAMTIGRGCLIAPTQLETDGTLRASEAVLRLLAENGYTAYYGGSPENAFYLAYVADGNKTGGYNGYTCAAALYPVTQPKGLNIRTDISPSLKAYLAANAGYFDETDYETNFRGYLGEFVYSDGSGWMFSLNGRFVQQDLASVRLHPGDTLRVRYTLCLGADIGGAEPTVQKTYDDFMRALNTPALQEEPTTAKQEPTTAKQEPTTAKQEPTTAKQEPTTTKQEPTTAKQEPTTAEQEPTTAEQEPTTAEPEPTAAEPEPTLPESEPAATEPAETPSELPGTDGSTLPPPAASAENAGDGPAPAEDGRKNLIPVISAAAAVPVAAAAVIIVTKIRKKKESV